MKPSDPAELPSRGAYYAAAAAWADETIAGFGREAKIAWRVAAGAILLAAANGLALLLMQPLREVATYAVPVDRQGGSALISYPLQSGALQSDPAVIQSMVARYVTARERFGAARLAASFRLVELMSDPEQRAAYAASLKPTSGVSPLAIYPPQAIVDVAVISVSLLDASDALVRYTTTRGDLPGAQPQQALANVSFRFTRGPMRQVDRFENPLGFQVTRYSTSPA